MEDSKIHQVADELGNMHTSSPSCALATPAAASLDTDWVSPVSPGAMRDGPISNPASLDVVMTEAPMLPESPYSLDSSATVANPAPNTESSSDQLASSPLSALMDFSDSSEDGHGHVDELTASSPVSRSIDNVAHLTNVRHPGSMVPATPSGENIGHTCTAVNQPKHRLEGSSMSGSGSTASTQSSQSEPNLTERKEKLVEWLLESPLEARPGSKEACLNQAGTLSFTAATTPTSARILGQPQSFAGRIDFHSQSAPVSEPVRPTSPQSEASESSALSDHSDNYIKSLGIQANVVTPTPTRQRRASGALSTQSSPSRLIFQSTPKGARIIELQTPVRRPELLSQSGPLSKSVSSHDRCSSGRIIKEASEGDETPAILEIRHSRGTNAALGFPDEILGILERWHKAHPESTAAHPCKINFAKHRAWNVRIFDEDAEEFDSSIWRVKAKGPIKFGPYYVMLLHPDNGPVQLVSDAISRGDLDNVGKRIWGQYIFAWVEAKANFDERFFALRVWRHDDNMIAFNPLMFDCGGVPRIPPPLAWTLKSDPERPVPIAEKDSDVHDPVAPSKRAEPVKRAKSNPIGEETQKAIEAHCDDLAETAKVRIKLVEAGDVIRCFDTDDADVFFKKAREFFQSRPPGFLFTHPSFQGQRYIGDNCDDEFDMLLNDVCRSSRGAEDQIVVVPARVRDDTYQPKNGN